MYVIERSACPETGFDTIALGTSNTRNVGTHQFRLRLKRRKHLIVESIAAGANARALNSVDAHIAVGTLSNDTRHTTRPVLLKHDHGTTVAKLNAIVGSI